MDPLSLDLYNLNYTFVNLGGGNLRMPEVSTILVSLAGGGAAGALLNEWFRRRRDRVQSIPLIERVNRLISPELKGFTLARVVGSSTNRGLEEVKNLREYQLTIRNTSTRTS